MPPALVPVRNAYAGLDRAYATAVGCCQRRARSIIGRMKSFRQTNVCMVRPAAFGFNTEAAASNRFQQADGAPGGAASMARNECTALAAALRAAGIGVALAEDSTPPARPDAVFPNNWVSFHDDG